MPRDLSFLPMGANALAERSPELDVFFDDEGAWCWSLKEHPPRLLDKVRAPPPVWRIDPDGTITQVAGPPTDWEPVVARLYLQQPYYFVHLGSKLQRVYEKENRDV